MKKFKNIKNINQYRDFIHIDDVSRSIKCLIEKQVQNPINISSGKKVNLIKACNILNKKYVKKETIYDYKKGKDIYGNNALLRKLGIKRFKNIRQSLLSYKK